jgi:predicted phosphoribosyltransferase
MIAAIVIASASAGALIGFAVAAMLCRSDVVIYRKIGDEHESFEDRQP